MRFGKGKLLAAVGVAALLSGVGVTVASAGASTAPPPNTTYHGCVNLQSRLITNVYTEHTPNCGSNAFAAEWNAQGPRGPQGPAGPQGSVDLYNSLVPHGIYSQSMYLALTQFGDAVNLAPNPANADLGTVNLGMIMCSQACTTTGTTVPASTASVTFNIYSLNIGGTPGVTPFASVTDSNVAVPGVPANETQVEFTVPFNFAPLKKVMPASVVYGVVINSNPTQDLNVALAPNVATGSSSYPGDIYVSTTPTDLATLTSNIGTCTGNHLASDPTKYQPVPVNCASGYDQNVESTADVAMSGNDGRYGAAGTPDFNFQGIDSVPAVQFLTAG